MVPAVPPVGHVGFEAEDDDGEDELDGAEGEHHRS